MAKVSRKTSVTMAKVKGSSPACFCTDEQETWLLGWEASARQRLCSQVDAYRGDESWPPRTSQLLGIRSLSSLQDSSDRDPLWTSTGRGNRAEERKLGLESLGEGSAKASACCLHLRAGSSHQRTPFTSWLSLSPANKGLGPCSSERLLRFLNCVASLIRKPPTTTSPVASQLGLLQEGAEDSENVNPGSEEISSKRINLLYTSEFHTA